MDQSLLESMRVIALPTKTNFRGVNLREVALFQGEYGWGEFSPFLEYDFQECVPWLMSAIEAATQPRPELLRTSIRVNGTIPALDDKSEIEKIIESKSAILRFEGDQYFDTKTITLTQKRALKHVLQAYDLSD